MEKLQKPTPELVDKFISKFESNEDNKSVDDAITKLIKDFPENKLIEDVLLKVTVINSLYSTNIFATFMLAKHIYSLKIDQEIKSGNPEIVNKIAKNHGITRTKNNKEIYLFSFATKYCSWHNKQDYAIYDRFVEKVLIAYRKQDGFSNFKTSDLRDFKIFKQTMNDFIRFYGLHKYDLKQIDKFLWSYGKSIFPTPN